MAQEAMMDFEQPFDSLATYNLNALRTMFVATEEMWQLPRFWLTSWCDLIVDSWEEARDLDRRD